MVVNRRKDTRRRFSDVTFAFQVRLEVRCAPGLYPARDMTGYGSPDPDAALADLHYCDVADYAVGCNTSAGWAADADGVVRAAYTDFLPAAEVERVEPNEKIDGRRIRHGGPGRPRRERTGRARATRSATCRRLTRPGSPPGGGDRRHRRRPAAGDSAQRLINSARQARDRIAAGIALLRSDAMRVSPSGR